MKLRKMSKNMNISQKEQIKITKMNCIEMGLFFKYMNLLFKESDKIFLKRNMFFYRQIALDPKYEHKTFESKLRSQFFYMTLHKYFEFFKKLRYITFEASYINGNQETYYFGYNFNFNY